VRRCLLARRCLLTRLPGGIRRTAPARSGGFDVCLWRARALLLTDAWRRLRTLIPPTADPVPGKPDTGRSSADPAARRITDGAQFAARPKRPSAAR